MTWIEAAQRPATSMSQLKPTRYPKICLPHLFIHKLWLITARHKSSSELIVNSIRCADATSMDLLNAGGGGAFGRPGGLPPPPLRPSSPVRWRGVTLSAVLSPGDCWCRIFTLPLPAGVCWNSGAATFLISNTEIRRSIGRGLWRGVGGMTNLPVPAASAAWAARPAAFAVLRK